MKFNDVLTSAREAASVRRVFADPIERDGVTLVPAARISTGGGGGDGHDESGQGGEGGGFGAGAKPVGAYVLKDGTARWVPAVDVNRLLAIVGVVAIVFLFTRVRLEKERARSTAA